MARVRSRRPARRPQLVAQGDGRWTAGTGAAGPVWTLALLLVFWTGGAAGARESDRPGAAASTERLPAADVGGGTAGPEDAVPIEASLRLADLWGGLEVQDLSGRTWTAADLAGRAVLIEFWATWCAPCLADFPVLKGALRTYGPNDVVILGVSLDRSERRSMTSFARRHEMTWPLLLDGLGPAGAVARRFQADYPPRSFLFDRTGRLVAVDTRGETLDAALRVLLAPNGP